MSERARKGRPDRVPIVIEAPRTDPVYNCHAYLTKVPIAGILPFINAFTDPGDIVVDFFAGSGMTGIAAAMLGRAARLSDISVLGQHIAAGYLTEVAPSDYRAAALEVAGQAKARTRELYITRRMSDGKPVEMLRTVWSFTYCCLKCSKEMIYFKHLGKGGGQPESCARCSAKFVRRSWPRAEDVPVQVVVRGQSGRLVEQDVQGARPSHDRFSCPRPPID